MRVTLYSAAMEEIPVVNVHVEQAPANLSGSGGRRSADVFYSSQDPIHWAKLAGLPL